MFHPVTSALGKRYPTKLYGIHIVFNAVPVLIPVPLDELDQVIDADGFVAAAPAVIAAYRYRLAVLDADSNIFSGIASAITVETPECQFLFYREKIEKLEERCRSLPSATDMLRQGMSPEEILSFVLEGMDPVVRDKKPVRFRCDCSRERVEKAIIAMGAKEIRSLIADGKPVTLNCGFCNTDYTFSIDDLILLLSRAQRQKA